MTITLSLAALLASCGERRAAYDATGTFEATEVRVAPEVSGKILRLSVEEGQRVEAGETVALIDTMALSLEREGLKRKREAVASRRVDIPSQLAAALQEIATTRNERQRFENLARANAAGRKQVDDLEGRLVVLEREVAARRIALEEHNRGVAAELSALEVEIARVEEQLSRLRVSSPISGTVLAKYAEEGEVALAGKALFKVSDLERMILRGYALSSQLSRVKVGQAVKVFIEDEEEDGGRRAYPGRVSWISDRAEFTPKSVQTRDERANLVYAIKVATPNDGRIRIGMYGEIQFEE